MSRSVRTAALRDAVEPWCAMGATGALRVLEAPGGTVYLNKGRIVYAECPPACGVDRLLTASGQVGAEAWRAVRAAARAGRPAGALLVEQGLVTPVDLEALVLCALHSAAFFLLHIGAEVRFEVEVRHAFGTIVEVDLDAACAEADRRRENLAEAWPDSTMDSSAVLPIRRLPGRFVALNALQWEIVANADRRRTPVDLARVLGRDTYATLLEVRRMACAGLVEPGRPAPAPARGTAPVRPDAPPPDTDTGGDAPLGPDARGREADGPEDTRDAVGTRMNGETGPLPRRAEQESAAPPPAGNGIGGPLDDSGWEDILLRIRDALEAL